MYPLLYGLGENKPIKIKIALKNGYFFKFQTKC